MPARGWESLTDEERRRHVERRIAEALRSVINETPEGAPGGLLYAPLMGLIDLAAFNRIMGLLVAAGWVTQRGDLYFPTGGTDEQKRGR
jgi:hypothetical protein